MRIVIAEDSVLLREGLASLLEDDGHEAVARVGDAESLLAVVAEHEPDLAIVDVRMPPGYGDEGIVAAAALRERYPAMGVLLLSEHIESGRAVALVTSRGGFGYLLKDRVLAVDDFLDAARRVAAGGTALDPEVVAALIARREGPVALLTPRERQVLELMAQGCANRGIARQLYLNERTVETHVRSIMLKFDIAPSDDLHRRVLAVVTYLRDASRGPTGRPPRDANR